MRLRWSEPTAATLRLLLHHDDDHLCGVVENAVCDEVIDGVSDVVDEATPPLAQPLDLLALLLAEVDDDALLSDRLSTTSQITSTTTGIGTPKTAPKANLPMASLMALLSNALFWSGGAVGNTSLR